MNFPVIEAIVCMARARTLEIMGYCLQATKGGQFRRQDKEVMEAVLRRDFPNVRNWRLSVQSEKSRDILIVTATPPNSIESEDSFAVYNRLREIVKPRVSHSALLVLKEIRRAPREFVVEALVLGHPSEKIQNELELRMRSLSTVRHVEKQVGNPRQFKLVARGNVQDASTIRPFLNELRGSAGIASLVVASSSL